MQPLKRGRGRANKWQSPEESVFFSSSIKGPELPNTELLMSHFSFHAKDFLNNRYKLQINLSAK